jgi:hypothetical protein
MSSQIAANPVSLVQPSNATEKPLEQIASLLRKELNSLRMRTAVQTGSEGGF